MERFGKTQAEPNYAISDTAAATGERRARHEGHDAASWVNGRPLILLQGLLFGLAFGFLLQKGGVAKFDILVGVLLLEKFTVVKVMLSAIIVGMVSVFALNRLGLLELQVNKTVLGANVIGGLIFGVGFGLIAYCPGTNAAAVGQGNLDALVGIAGMILGSYVFALTSNYTSGRFTSWGDLGKKTLPNIVGVPAWLFIAVAAPLLVAVLVLLELFVGA
jgi:hypothetical protein